MTWRRLFAKRPQTISAKERTIFLDSFAKDISPKAIKQFISETDRIILRHTTAEYQVLDMLHDNRQLMVQGGPGSGKTWLALEQAFRFANEGLQVLALCYRFFDSSRRCNRQEQRACSRIFGIGQPCRKDRMLSSLKSA
jgi:predicted NACHT family NTPase